MIRIVTCISFISYSDQIECVRKTADLSLIFMYLAGAYCLLTLPCRYRITGVDWMASHSDTQSLSLPIPGNSTPQLVPKEKIFNKDTVFKLYTF